jgi:hypothetical protein
MSATVWWFLAPFMTADNLVALENSEVSYPPTRDRPKPQANGADLLGRFFFEPELGVCCITRLCPIVKKRMTSRSLIRSRLSTEQPIALGTQHTLYYQCIRTLDEHYSSVDETVQWIAMGPILQAPPRLEVSHRNVTAPPTLYPRNRNSYHYLWALSR